MSSTIVTPTQQQAHISSALPYDMDIHPERLEKLSEQANKRECQMRNLEAALSENLSNFRAIDSLMQEAFTGVQKTIKRADRALTVQVPQINQELRDSMEVLDDLAEILPTIRDQVESIQCFYDKGKQKAERLETDLIWLNKDFYERWRCIIFDESPVSWRWKAIMRSLFAASFLICSWLFWLVLAGAYKAHRHRLVWGDRLMS
jgi:hypothetical protein